MKTSPLKMSPGYAYTSSKRHPAEPETVMVSKDECRQANHVGTAVVDGSRVEAFRLNRRYFFQIPVAVCTAERWERVYG